MEIIFLSTAVGLGSIVIALVALVIGYSRLTLQFTAMRKSEIDKQIGEVLRHVLEANLLTLSGAVSARERLKLLKEQIRVYLAVWEDDPFLKDSTPYMQAAYSNSPGLEQRQKIIEYCSSHTHEIGTPEAAKCKHHAHGIRDYTEPVIVPVKKKKKHKIESSDPKTAPIQVVTEEIVQPSILECCAPDGNKLVKYVIEDELVALLKSLKYANHSELKLSRSRLKPF